MIMIIFNRIPFVLLLLFPCASAGFVMRKRKSGRPPWNPPALAPARSSLLTGNAYRDGAMRREALSARFAFRITCSGYTVNQKKALVDVEVTIRGSLEVPRINYHPQNPEFVPVNDDTDSDYAECSPASSLRVSYFRSVALIFIVILLVRNLVGVMTAGEDHYAFTILPVFLLRASGILLPLYLVMRFIAAFQEAEQEDHLQQQQLLMEEIFSAQRETLDERLEHRIQIRL